MSRFLLAIATFCAAGILAACATLSEAECQAGDWRSIGIGDGSNGYPASWVDKHISACSEYDIALDRQLYETGRKEGLRVYCRLDRAESAGRAGRTNYNSCQGEIGVSFNRVYTAARAINELESRMSTIEGEISQAVSELAKPGLDDAAREALRRKIESLQSTRRVLERQRSMSEAELASIRRDESLRLSRLGIAY